MHSGPTKSCKFSDLPRLLHYRVALTVKPVDMRRRDCPHHIVRPRDRAKCRMPGLNRCQDLTSAANSLWNRRLWLTPDNASRGTEQRQQFLKEK